MNIVTYSKKDMASFFKARLSDSNKSDYGKFLIIGGSLGMMGALKLCASACCRAGAGLVYISAVKEHMAAYNMLCTEAIVLSSQDLLNHLSDKKCICIGCGWEVNAQNSAMFKKVLDNSSCHIIADAGALHMLAADKDILKKHGHRMTILPHPGEMSVLTGKSIEQVQKDRQNIAYSFYEKYKCTTVLKGSNTVVAGEGGVYINSSGNPGMAAGGSGDVLAGIVCAYTAMVENAFDRACLSVYMHGYAGDLAAKELGQISMIASDLIAYLPYAHKEVAGGKA